VVVDKVDVSSTLGRCKFFHDIAEHTSMPGVSTGLAWTPVGGDILFIEATAMPGKGKLVLTGKLGDVMKESAQAALSWVRAHCAELVSTPASSRSSTSTCTCRRARSPRMVRRRVTRCCRRLSRCSPGRKVRSDVAMTGEMTLRGAVLPVGGIKSKVLAAHRAGIKTVFLPERNAKDILEVPRTCATS
jgi:ATP-dependent Lon protease